MKARLLLFSLLCTAGTTAMADNAAYELSLHSSVQDNRLTVAPRVTAPAGSQLRYEFHSTKSGPAGNAQTSQSGRVAVGSSGSADLSTLNLGVGSADRYTIIVKVFEGQQLVAERTLHHPQH